MYVHQIFLFFFFVISFSLCVSVYVSKTLSHPDTWQGTTAFSLRSLPPVPGAVGGRESNASDGSQPSFPFVSGPISSLDEDWDSSISNPLWRNDAPLEGSEAWSGMPRAVCDDANQAYARNALPTPRPPASTRPPQGLALQTP